MLKLDTGISKQGNIATYDTTTIPDNNNNNNAAHLYEPEKSITRTCITILRALTKDMDIFDGENEIFIVAFPENDHSDYKQTKKVFSNNNSPEFHETFCWPYDIDSNIVFEISDRDDFIIFERDELIGYSKINPKNFNGFQSLKIVNPNQEPNYIGEFLTQFFQPNLEDNVPSVLHVNVFHECM